VIAGLALAAAAITVGVMWLFAIFDDATPFNRKEHR
jgi:hypothetical protein